MEDGTQRSEHAGLSGETEASGHLACTSMFEHLTVQPRQGGKAGPGAGFTFQVGLKSRQAGGGESNLGSFPGVPSEPPRAGPRSALIVLIVVSAPLPVLSSSGSQTPQVWLLEGSGWSSYVLLALIPTARLSFPRRRKAWETGFEASSVSRASDKSHSPEQFQTWLLAPLFDTLY